MNISYLPVVLLHGIFSGASYMEPIRTYLEQQFPSISVVNVKYGEDEILTSFSNIENQLDLINTFIQQQECLKNKPFIFIGHSQGGLLARCWIEKYGNTLRPHTLISLGSPQAGYFGIPDMFNTISTALPQSSSVESSAMLGFYQDLFTEIINSRDSAYELFYASETQEMLGLSEYWKDPKHYDQYFSCSQMLPYYNNEKVHPLNKQYKDNITALTKIVLVASTQDDVIEPPNSAHWMFYKPNSDTVLEENFTSTDQYTNNLLGLKDMYDAQKIDFKEVHCVHTQYQDDPEVLHLIGTYMVQDS